MSAKKTQRVTAKMIKVNKDAVALGAHPTYGPFVEKQQGILLKNILTALDKYEKKMSAMYKKDAGFKAAVDQLAESQGAVDDEILYGEGTIFEDKEGALEKAGAQFNAAGLWSIGMNASKTKAVANKMEKLQKEAATLGSDPVYGPFIEKNQGVLVEELYVALDKYEKVMAKKYTTDAGFKKAVNQLKDSQEALDDELLYGAGSSWTA